jgi:hypothetical protein
VISFSYRWKERRTFRSFLFLSAAMMLLFSPARADEIRDLFDSVGHSQISFGVSSTSRRNTASQPGSFAQRATIVGAAIPFAGTLGENSSLWTIRASLRAATADASILPERVTLFSGRIGISDMIFSGLDDDYFIFGSIGFASDDESMNMVRWRFSGTGLGTHTLRRGLELHYGLVYSYTLGRGLLLPLAGIRWIPSERWTIRAVLPVSLRASYRADERWSFGSGVAVDGDRFQFSNDGEYPAAPRHAYLRLTQVECGLDLNLQFSPLISISGEAGIAVARRLWISSDIGDYFSTHIASGGYGRTTIHFSL